MIRGGYWGGAWGLSWAGAWGEAWILLNQPYQELSLKGQVFVRSYLTRIYSVEVAEQIVSVAALNNISVLKAAVSLAAEDRCPRGDAVTKALGLTSVCRVPPLTAASTEEPYTAVSVADWFFAETKLPGAGTVLEGSYLYTMTFARADGKESGAPLCGRVDAVGGGSGGALTGSTPGVVGLGGPGLCIITSW